MHLTITQLKKQFINFATLLLTLSTTATWAESVSGPELLAADEAFQVSFSQNQQGDAVFEWKIDSCCYLYKDQIKISDSNGELKNISFPTSVQKNDPDFGLSEVYTQSLRLLVSRSEIREGSSLQLRSQGCNQDVGICYPPQKNEFSLISAGGSGTINGDVKTPSQGQTQAQGTQTASKGVSEIILLIVGAFVSGLLLTFTPCVLPMLPILSSIIVGGGESISKSRGVILASTFVMGTTVTYAAIGAVAGASGQQLQAYFQHPAVIGCMALVLLVMALSMFGLFTVQMPGFIQSRLQSTSSGLKGGKIGMVFLIGLLSSLIIGACVSPVLISFLGVAMSSKSPMLGALIMFFMALGMGVPLILFGAGAGSLLPKAGMWMDSVKHIFGVMLMGVALYLLDSIPAVPVLFLWACALITLGIFLGATQALALGANLIEKLKKGVGTVVLVWGIMSLVGSAYGERSIFKPLPSALMGQNSQVQTAPTVFTTVNDLASFNERKQLAQAQGKHILVDFYADWCTDCKKMDRSTFKDAALLTELKQDFILLKVDLTDPNEPGPSQIKDELGVFGPPAILFFHAEHGLVKDANFYGYKSALKLGEQLKIVRGHQANTPST